MIDYAQDVKTCRKVSCMSVPRCFARDSISQPQADGQIKFAKYFSTSAQLSANAWDNAADLASTDTGTGTGTGTSTGGGRGGGNVTTCGKCDNCLRDPETLQTRDVTLDAWKILHVAQYVNTHGGRLTASGLVDLARGLGGGKFAVMERTKRGKSRSSGEGFLDLGGLVGDKVGMNKDVR
jgi:ATP-dependent DNA helicase Q1